MRFAMLTFLMVFSTVPGQAQATWKQEPLSFLGVTFGKPLSSSYPECPSRIQGGRRIYKPGVGSACWELSGNDAVLVQAGEFFAIYVESINGNVASITASFRHSDFDRIANDLIAKYGEPQWRNVPTVEMLGGRKLPSKGLNWFGKEISIFCESQSPKADEGTLGVANSAWQQYLARIAVE
jgi:hypothetical protein